LSEQRNAYEVVEAAIAALSQIEEEIARKPWERALAAGEALL
jgi:HEAT repeat protein